jgi:hypothetical protein
MRFRQATRALVAVGMMFLLIQSWLPSLAAAQECRLPPVDSQLVWRVLDSLEAGGLPARHRDVAFDETTVVTGGRCQHVVAARLDGGVGGAVIIADSGGRIALANRYSGAQLVRSVGHGSVAFTYVAGRGAGRFQPWREDRFVVLCAFGTRYWIECVDLEQRRSFETVLAGQGGLAVEREAAIRLLGDTIVVESQLRWREYSNVGVVRRESARISLGRWTVLIPQ